MKKLLVLASSLFIIACGHPSEEVVRIGAILPLSGGMAEMGEELQRSLIAEVEYINDRGGVLGKEMKIVFGDGQCNAGKATESAQRLIRVKKVPIILGGLCSPETLGAAPIAEKNKVILITSVSGASSISEAGDFIFRNAPEGDTNGEIMADYSNEKGYEKVALVNEISDFPMSVRESFLSIYSGEVIEESFAPGTTDFHTIIMRIKDAGVDALFFNPQQNQSFVLFMKQLQEAKWEGQLFFNNTVVGHVDLYEGISEFMEDNNSLAGSYDVVSNPKQEAVVGRFAAMWERPAQFRHLLANQKDSLSLIVNAIEHTGDEYDTEGIRDFLYLVKDYKGASGTFSIDPDGDAGKSYSLVKFNGESFEPME